MQENEHLHALYKCSSKERTNGGATVDANISLVERAKHGDTEAFGELYNRIYKELYKFAYYTLANREDAEDAVSETFFEGFKGINKLRDSALFKPWIFKILTVKCKRKISVYVKNRETISPDDISDHVISFDLNGVNDEKIALLTALSGLETDERAIVVLSAVQGYTAKEVAHILGCPVGTVSSKLHRTLKKLRTELERK